MPAIVSVDLIEIAVSEGFSPLGTAPNCLCMHTHVRLREWIVNSEVESFPPAISYLLVSALSVL